MDLRSSLWQRAGFKVGGISGCCSLPYTDGTQGFLAQMQQSAQVNTVQIANTRPQSSVTAAAHNRQVAGDYMHRRAQQRQG